MRLSIFQDTRPRLRSAIDGGFFRSVIALAYGLAAFTANARDEAAIREVASGQRTEARAEWWGFDEADATQALQSAIDSKAKKVVIGNVGKPWNVRPIRLAGDQEIVFEKGAVVQAVRGAFKKKTEMLLRGNRVRNLTISGEGATLRMWKADYQAAPYEKSEWRHTLAFYACENVTVRGVTIAESGGDGIYLGAGAAGAPCRNVTIRDVQCVNHHRQGISVISAEDLLVENCAFNDTGGTAPQAGIDFEPNSQNERLKNCVLRNCTFASNTSYGILFALSNLDEESEPISIRFENCRTIGNSGAVRISMHNMPGVRGSIAFDRCRFEGSTKNGIESDNKAVKGAAVSFAHCQFVNLANETPEQSPIGINCRGGATETLGGIVFDDCTIEDLQERKPLFYDDIGGARLKEVTGTLNVKRGGGVERIELTQALLDQWFPWSAELKDYARFDMKGLAFEPAFPHAPRPFPPFVAWQRGTAQFAVWAREGGNIEFTLALKPVGRGEIKPAPARMIAPSGKVTELPPVSGTEPQHQTFKATESGVHRIVCEAGQHTAALQSPSEPACLMSLRGGFHFVGRTGSLCFLVPKGVGEFALKIAGGGGTERVKATIRDAAGKVVASRDNIVHGEQFPFSRGDAARAEVWSLTLERPSQGVIEDVQIRLEGVPPFLAASPGSIFKPAGREPEEAPISPPPN